MARGERGSIRWHQNRWELRVQHDGRRVTRRIKAPDTRAGRREAEAALEQLVVELGLDCEALTVRQLLDRHELIKAPGWSPSTLATYRHHRQPVLDGLGDVEISKLRAADIEKVYGQWVAAGLAPATVRRRHSVLSAALNQAERWGMILKSPCRMVELPAADRSNRSEDLPDVGAVLSAVGRLEHERLRVTARLALATGARRGELVGLRWCDIDLDAGTIRIAGAIAIGENGLVRKGTKSGERRSAMSIDPGTVAVLKSWRAKVASESMLLGAGRPAPESPLLPSPSDPRRPWHPDRVTSEWIRHRDEIGLGGLRWHDLRHLHATVLLAAGVAGPAVAARLGHASTKMTLDVYAHALPADDAAAASVIGRASGDAER